MSFQTRNFRVLPYLTAITLTMTLLCATAVAETIYKSVDAQGNVTFSNMPPPAGVKAQQIEVQPGPTPAEQRQSLEAERNLETQGNAIPEENPEENSEEESAPEESQEEPAVEPTTEYQQESDDPGDDEEPVVVDEGYVADPNRDERLRDGVDDVREVTPLPAEVHRPAGRVR